MTLYMPLFKSCKTPRALSQLHAHLFISGLHKDILASTKLIEAYSQMGNLHSSQLVFNTFTNPDSFMWCVLIKNYVWNHFYKEAISLYDQLHVCDRYIFPSLLKACSGLSDVRMGRKFHGKIVKSGVEFDKFVETALLCMYSECCSLDEACKVFDAMSMKDVVSWSSMVLSYVRNGRVYEGLDMFRKMVFQGIEVDSVTMLSVIEACYLVCDRKIATSVHSYVLKRMMRGIGSDGSLVSSLIVMYSTRGDLENAERLFNQATCLNNASWTAMISCYNKKGRFEEALEIYVKMQECNVEPNSVAVVGVLVACSRLFWLRGGMSVHGYILRCDIDLDFGTVGSALIEMYASCRKLGDCQKVFHSINDRTIVSWNSIISVYARNGLAEEALGLFIQLRLHGLLPDSFTLASSLSACGKSGYYQLGSQIHSLIVKTCFDSNEYVQNSLIDMYSKCGFVDIAYKIFGEMQEKSLITWNSMVCGFSQNGKSVEAIRLLDQMHYKNLEMDNVTFLSAIQSCSHLCYLEKGKCFHHKLIINGLEKDSYVDTALTDMYAKCGDLPMAQRVFDTMLERSVVAWSAMIAGYGIHGCLDNAISLFTQMVGLGIRPNDVTFISILSACSHAGSLEQGTFYFNLMRKEYGIEPELEHFIFMVDLLSRAGDLTGALRIINTMSVPATSSIWGALLNGCRIHGRFDMVETIRKTILDLEPNNSGYYTLLSNLYAEGGKWDDFREMRTMMKDIGVRKVPGFSMIQINKNMYRFGAGDTTYSQSKEIFKILEDLERLAQEQGYISERRLPIRSSDKDPQGMNVNFHSEKLALAFGIINTSPGTTLRISKNLRVCTDCHSFTKFVSKVTNREIIMRDLNRFHHFSNGTCSCRDFW